ncbi:MAG: hypothetical protein RLZZ361_431 [Cyanobacteriota bacterium]
MVAGFYFYNLFIIMVSLSAEVGSLIENRVNYFSSSQGPNDFRGEILEAKEARNRISKYLENLEVAEEFEREVTPKLVSVSLQELTRAFVEGESSKFIELCKKMNGSVEYLHKPNAIRDLFDNLLKDSNSNLDLIIEGFREVFRSPKIGLRISAEQFVSFCSNDSKTVINLLKNLDQGCFYKIMNSILTNSNSDLKSIQAFKFAFKLAPEVFKKSLQIYKIEPEKYNSVPKLLREFLEHQVQN